MDFGYFDKSTKSRQVKNMEKTFEDEIIGAIKKFTAGYTSVRAAAESLGVTYETFRSWHDGIKSPSIKSLSPIARKIGLSLAPEVPTIKRVGSNAPIEKVEGEDLQKVPVYSVAGAGPGVMLDSIEPMFTVVAPPDYFRKSNCAVLVEGHSMEPMIPHGSVVGIKCDVPFKANEIFLADIPYEGLVVKRVGVDLKNNEFIFKSENPDKEAYPDFRLSIAEAEKIIIGRVVWITIGY